MDTESYIEGTYRINLLKCNVFCFTVTVFLQLKKNQTNKNIK